MTARRRASNRGGGAGRPGARREWVGGRLSPPFTVDDPGGAFRPELVVWMEAPSGLVVGSDVVVPEAVDGALGRSLIQAMERPLAGLPRRPNTIRVADEALAGEVRSALADAIPIVVAPTPELDQLLELMLESKLGETTDQSYFEDGRISPAIVGALFAAARTLCRIAPWTVATDDQLVRMDIPDLGVEGAVVSIIGHLGQSRGLIVFPSLDAYTTFRLAAERPLPRRGPVDVGTDWLVLNYERATDLPPSMRREAMAHAWPVAGADAYPRIVRHGRDTTAQPLGLRDVQVATACALSLSAFFVTNRGLFQGEAIEPACQSYYDENDLEVRFTAPYEAFSLFDLDAENPPEWVDVPAQDSSRLGRNDPCHCGSGRKYKKCHLSHDERERSLRREQQAIHELDGSLIHELIEFAVLRFGPEWRRFEKDFADVSQVLQFALPWATYNFEVQGASSADWYLKEPGSDLSPEVSAWLEAQTASWPSIWEVTEVEAGGMLTLHDLLTGETRRVLDVKASRSLRPHRVVLARIVEHEGRQLLCGLYPRSLPEEEAAEVVRRARGRLRRKGAVPVDRLRDERIGRYLIRRWEEAFAKVAARWSVAPRWGPPEPAKREHKPKSRQRKPLPLLDFDQSR